MDSSSGGGGGGGGAGEQNRKMREQNEKPAQLQSRVVTVKAKEVERMAFPPMYVKVRNGTRRRDAFVILGWGWWEGGEFLTVRGWEDDAGIRG